MDRPPPVSERWLVPPAPRELLEELLAPVAPASFEAPVGAVVARAGAGFGSVAVDGLGNVAVTVNAGASPSVALVAHMDEVGAIVKHVDDAGRLWLGPIGIVDPVVLIGQRVVVAHGEQRIDGVVGATAPHHGAARAVPGFDDLWVDIGAADREEALRRVALGDPLVLDGPPLWLTDSRVSARALDNRLGVLIALHAARAVAAEPDLAAEVTVLATTREETSCAGASAALAGLAPDVAIVVDCTFASDVPEDGIERRVGRRPLGSGPTISRGGPHEDRITAALLRLAHAAGLAHTVEAEGDRAGTDADALAGLPGGTRCGGIGIPVRHMHSPAELADIGDVRGAAELAARFCLTAGDAVA